MRHSYSEVPNISETWVNVASGHVRAVSTWDLSRLLEDCMSRHELTTKRGMHPVWWTVKYLIDKVAWSMINRGRLVDRLCLCPVVFVSGLCAGQRLGSGSLLVSKFFSALPALGSGAPEVPT